MPDPAAERAASIIELWRDDPLQAWMDWLPPEERPREWQPEALDDLRNPDNRRIAIVTAREGGKSRVQAMIGIHHLVTRPGSLVLCIAPIQRQARSAVWAEVKILWERSPVLRGLFPGWRVQEGEIVTDVAGWRMASLATDDPAGLEGWHSPDTLVLIDEAQSLPDAHWSSLQGVNPSRLVACGTGGDDTGWFAEAFGRLSWLWNVTRRVTALEIPRLREVLAREEKRLGADNPILRRMWLAEFCSASEYSIFDESLLQRARGFDPWPQVYFGNRHEERVILGVDPARGGPKGDDAAVAVAIVRGDRVKVDRIAILPPGDEMQLAAAVVVEARRCCASTVVVEAAGLGHGVYSRVRELLRDTRTSVQAFVGVKKPRHDETAANVKAEVVLRLRTMLLENKIGLPAAAGEFDRLANELMRLRLVTTLDGKVRIADGPASPDYADAVIAGLSAAFRRPGIVGVSEAQLMRDFRRWQ